MYGFAMRTHDENEHLEGALMDATSSVVRQQSTYSLIQNLIGDMVCNSVTRRCDVIGMYTHQADVTAACGGKKSTGHLY